MMMTRDGYWRRIEQMAEDVWRMGPPYDRVVNDAAMDWAYSISNENVLVVLASTKNPPNGARLRDHLDHDADVDKIMAILAFLAIQVDIANVVSVMHEQYGVYDSETMRKRWQPKTKVRR